jgi:hypothetical protein
LRQTYVVLKKRLTDPQKLGDIIPKVRLKKRSQMISWRSLKNEADTVLKLRLTCSPKISDPKSEAGMVTKMRLTWSPR